MYVFTWFSYKHVSYLFVKFYPEHNFLCKNVYYFLHLQYIEL